MANEEGQIVCKRRHGCFRLLQAASFARERNETLGHFFACPPPTSKYFEESWSEMYQTFKALLTLTAIKQYCEITWLLIHVNGVGVLVFAKDCSGYIVCCGNSWCRARCRTQKMVLYFFSYTQRLVTFSENRSSLFRRDNTSMKGLVYYLVELVLLLPPLHPLQTGEPFWLPPYKKQRKHHKVLCISCLVVT